MKVLTVILVLQGILCYKVRWSKKRKRRSTLNWLKSDAQKTAEKLIGDERIPNVTAFRILLILNKLRQSTELASRPSIIEILKSKRKMTGQNLPQYWINRSLKILKELKLIERLDGDIVKITSNGTEVAQIPYLDSNTKMLGIILPPTCKVERMLEATELSWEEPITGPMAA